MPVKAIYIDDNKIDIAKFEKATSDLDKLEILGFFTDPLDALEFIQDNEVQLIFLDIDMPKINGIQLAEKVEQMPVRFAFVSNHKEYALKAFGLNALHYLEKPVMQGEILKTVARYEAYHQQQKLKEADPVNGLTSSNSRLFINTQKQIIVVQFIEIAYLCIKGSYTIFNMMDGNKITSGKPLKEYETDLLSNKDFVKVHRSYIINQANLAVVEKLKQEVKLIFKNGESFVIGSIKKDLLF